MGKSLFLVLVVATGLSHCQIDSEYKFQICKERDWNCVSVQCNVRKLFFLPFVRCTYDLNGKVSQLAPFPLIRSVGETIIDSIKDAVRGVLQVLGIFQNPRIVNTAESTTTRSTTEDPTTTKPTTTEPITTKPTTDPTTTTTQPVQIFTINIP